MKKIIIISALAVLLISGYFVGQAQFSAEAATKNTTVRNAVSQTRPRTGAEVAEDSLGKSDSPAAGCSARDCEIDQTLSSSVIDPCYEYDACVYPIPEPIPPVGNPKGTTIIKTGTVEITIARDSVNKQYDKVVSLIPEGGYVEASSSSQRVSKVTLRIPSEKLDETLVALRKIGTITKESIESLDRTFDAIDYDARLKIMHERETVLVEELKKASAEDTKWIQEQIFALRTEIESLQGQKDVLSSQVALSTLTVTLTEKGVKADKPGDQTMLGEAWTTSAGALLQNFGGILIVLTASFPFLILGLIVFVAVRSTLRKRNKNKVETNSTLL